MSKPQHPGFTLRFFLMESELSGYEAAERSGLTLEQLGDLVNGKLSVTPDLAEKLARIGGNSAMWLQLQADFEQAA